MSRENSDNHNELNGYYRGLFDKFNFCGFNYVKLSYQIQNYEV